MSEDKYADYENVDVETLVNQAQEIQSENTELKGKISAITHTTEKNPNLISFQLVATELLEKLERFYRGEYLHFEKDEGYIWKVHSDKDLQPLNNYGVNLMMEIVTKYIDKNTFLSNYSEERIYEILADIGDEMILVILCNYEKMGMDDYNKKTKFRILIVTTLHIIETAYRRSLDGKTMEDINQSRIVTQSDGLSRGRGLLPTQQPTDKRHFFDPRRIFGG